MSTKITLFDKLITQLKNFKEKPKVKKQWLAFKAFIRSVEESLKSDNLHDADSEFWSYHIAGIALILVLDTVINSLSSFKSIWGFFSLAYLSWGIGFFYAGLLIRSQYKKAHWENQPHLHILLKGFACSLFYSIVHCYRRNYERAFNRIRFRRFLSIQRKLHAGYFFDWCF